MANPYKLTRDALVPFLENLSIVLANGDLVPIDPAEQTARAAVINGDFVALQGAISDLIAAEAAYHAAVSAAESVQLLSLDDIQSVKYLMKASGCSGAVFSTAGFNPPVTDPVAYLPNDPTELSAFGFSNGVNALKWKGNNSLGAVVYVVQAKIGASTDWVEVGTSTKQRFQHTPVTPGIRYEYRVFARAASADSNPTGTAVVYGS